MNTFKIHWSDGSTTWETYEVSLDAAKREMIGVEWRGKIVVDVTEF